MRSSTPVRCLTVAFVTALLAADGLPSPLDELAGERNATSASPPEIHSVATAVTDGRRRLTVVGSGLGATRGQVRVGSRRARVRQWSDTTVSVRVARRVRGGVHAVELVRRDGVGTAAPAAVVLPGRDLRPGRLTFRIGRNRKGHRVRSSPQVADDELVASYSRTKKTTAYRWVAKRERRCSSSKVCFFVFLCGRRTICRVVNVRVRERYVKRRTWTVELHADLDGVDLSSPRVLTAATQGDDDASPITCIGPRSTVFDVDPDSPDWWIVVGRDDDGIVCGEFRATARDGRTVSGRFAGLPGQ